MTTPTPLLDFFKRGEVDYEARVLAAQGGLGIRAQEQLAILVVLLEDADADIRATADATIHRIPDEALRKFLARADVPIGLREFFADRGIFPAEIPAIESDDPIVEAPAEAAAAADEEEFDEKEERDTTLAKISKMGFTQRLKAAVKGTREMRSILIRDPNKMISAAVLSSPKLSEQEVESISRMANVSDDVLRTIAQNRRWMKNYNILLGLVKNPKTPVAMSLNMMNRLNDRDVNQLSVDRNVPEPLRIAARKKIVASTSGKR